MPDESSDAHAMSSNDAPNREPERDHDRGADDFRADILIVDDRPDKRLVYESILEDLGQRMFTAESGEQALKQVLDHDFAVILLDVNMPGMDGLETASLIRSRSRSAHVPIIFVTADVSDEQHMARGYALGAVDYIALPVVPEILRAKVKVFVDLWLLAQQAKRQAKERVAFVEERVARTAAEEASRRLAFLAKVSVTLAASLDFAAIVREIVRLCVPTVADVCALTLVGDAPSDPWKEVIWPEPAGVDLLQAPSGRAVGQALHPWLREAIDRVLVSGEAEVFADLPTMVEAVHSIAVVPLIARGRGLGALALGLGTPGSTFDVDALAMATKVAGRAAIALDNARLYEKIQEQDRRKDEFLAMLAHELRNPLAPISNAVHMLRIAEHDPQKLAWAREVIGRQLRQLVRLVDDLLDVSRITRGKIELKMGSVDVALVVAAAVETSRPYVDALEHTLTVTLPSEPLRLRGDFARVAQVLANLINNAAKYTEKGGQITLSASHEGHEIVFRVRDTGMGIPQELLTTIFEPFRQMDRTLDRSRGGLGIGLTLSRRLVEMQGGSLTAYSDGPGRGSEFTVRLPGDIRAESGEATLSEPELSQPSASLDLHVLVVDDNHDVADSTALLLRASGCRVDLAYDGEQAIEAVRALRPDAILLDIGLPKMDGYQVAERIHRERGAHAPKIIALSGYGQDVHRNRAKHAGFDYHIVKPIEPAALTGLLASLCAGKRKVPPSDPLEAPFDDAA